MADQHSVRARACDVQDQMRAMVTSHFVSQIVRAAVDLSLADHLAGEALTAAQVAEREGSAPDTTFRFMRACVAVGLLTADTHNRFASTSLLKTLRKDTPGSLRGLALATTLPAQWLSWKTSSPRQSGQATVKRASHWAWISSTTSSDIRRRPAISPQD